ncbi:hypothetical protein BLOT_005816 [Blomia tropicalis]|nr:hypothetical protein BLOT_005816 [Blomia tropicalis]
MNRIHMDMFMMADRLTPQWMKPLFFFNDNNNYIHEFYQDSPMSNMNHGFEPMSNFNYGHHNRPSSYSQLPPPQSTHDPYPEMEIVTENGPNNPIRAAVITHHVHKVIEVPAQPYRYREPTVIDLGSNPIYPIVFEFDAYKPRSNGRPGGNDEGDNRNNGNEQQQHHPYKNIKYDNDNYGKSANHPRVINDGHYRQ